MKQQLLAKLEANGQIDSLLARLQKYKELDFFPKFTYDVVHRVMHHFYSIHQGL